jgi:hypothetical protein
MAQCDDIEEILYEAVAYGIRNEVLDTAQQIIRTERFVDKVHAYERAFRQHVPATDIPITNKDSLP